MIASTLHSRVRNDSSSRRLERTFRMVRICLSHTPPMWLAMGGLKIQSVPSLSSLSWIWSWSISCMAWLSSLCAPMKFVPLSHLISLTGPQRAMKRRSAWIKETVSSEHAVSMCTALLTRQVKRDPYLFTSLRPSLTRNGPKLVVHPSIGKRVCRGSSILREIGHLLLAWWGPAHSAIRCQTAVLAPTIQYFSLSLASTWPRPAWPNCSWVWWMISVVTWLLRGRITGCFVSAGIPARLRRPPTRRTLWSRNERGCLSSWFPYSFALIGPVHLCHRCWRGRGHGSCYWKPGIGEMWKWRSRPLPARVR